MPEPSVQDRPLHELFGEGRAVVDESDSLPSGTVTTRRRLQHGILTLELALKLVDSVGMFSSNEDKDDIATAELKYLLIPFYLAELLSQLNLGDPADRRSVLMSAQERYMQYLHRARQYGLLGAEAASMLAALEEAGEGEDGGGRAGLGSDPAQLRQHKILKFKREREIRARLEAIQQLPLSRGGGEEGEGEVERETWILQIHMAALRVGAIQVAVPGGSLPWRHPPGDPPALPEFAEESWDHRMGVLHRYSLKAAEQVGVLRREAEILAHAASLPEEEREKTRPGPPPELKQKLLAAAGALQGQLGGREHVRQGVFRPSHALPSMTVEQWGEVELRRAQQAQRAEQEQRERERGRREALGEEGAEEEDLRKQRAWDDWCDDNPRGWGNSKLRPCG